MDLQEKEITVIGYSNTICPQCNRQRVEIVKVGNENYHICEKCNWNLDKNDYVHVIPEPYPIIML